MARSTVENTIERIRRQLNSNVRLEINTLGATLTTSTNPVTLSYDLANSVRSGAVLSVGRELMRVISVNVASKEVTVIRGWQDTDAEAHAIDDEVLINPRFTRFDIYDAIIQEIDSWEPDIFTTVDVTATVTGGETEGFEVPLAQANALGVISVNRNWTEDDSVVWPDMAFNLYRGRTASLTPTTGSGLFIRFTKNGGYAKKNGNVVARLAVPYQSSDITSEASDLVTDVGLTNSLIELVELGVKMRLMPDDEVARSGRGIQDEPRRDEAVQAGAAMNTGQAYLTLYNRRRAQEVRKIRNLYPFQTW